jgi:hypothetical protein
VRPRSRALAIADPTPRDEPPRCIASASPLVEGLRVQLLRLGDEHRDLRPGEAFGCSREAQITFTIESQPFA